MARTIQSALAGLEGSKISTNLNFDPRALALLRTFPRYQKRLESFKGTKWHSKPPCLNPLFCALYGWRNGLLYFTSLLRKNKFYSRSYKMSRNFANFQIYFAKSWVCCSVSKTRIPTNATKSRYSGSF